MLWIRKKHVLPLAGTREGLFSVLFPLMPVTRAGAKPIVAMPNPFYQCYAVAALAAGCEPLYVPATEASGFLPDYESLPPKTLERNAASISARLPILKLRSGGRSLLEKIFSPWPSGMDFIVLADDCYADIYYGAPPTTALPTRLKQSGGFSRLLTCHCLSKRSGLPGLRSGLVAGCSTLIVKFRAFGNGRRTHRAGTVAGGVGGGAERRSPCRGQPRPLCRTDGGGGKNPGQPDAPAGGRIFPLAEDPKWLGDGPSAVAGTGGQGAAGRLYGS